MAGLFNIQCALHDPNCHAHAQYLFESVEESTTSNSVPIKGNKDLLVFAKIGGNLLFKIWTLFIVIRLCFGEFFPKLLGTFKDAVSDKETFGTNFM
ncbi:hypothetical protein T01_12225 [Trichinella spiralis]|uniref:Uncharacterized protein n=1 Tax=Trichinella spiralis TaxID=6334 RepID=A0A0V1B5D6_TRISP|nr:hypothetical protein T01_12225 [Trichinella spiralis]